MRRWWGPEGFHVESLESDFRPGGNWRVTMLSRQFGESRSSGVFREIEKLRRIVFTFAWAEGSGHDTQTLVTVTFDEAAGRTTQHFHQTPFVSVESRDSHVIGWNSLFNKQQRYAETAALGETPEAED